MRIGMAIAGHVKRLIARLSPALFGLTMAGCVGGTSPVSTFYLLEPIGDVPDQRVEQDTRIAIGLRPVELPEYLDRPQIVTATADNTYRLSEFNRWAEALDGNITRVLARNLTLLSPVDVWPTRSSGLAKQADFRLNVDISEFHVDWQGSARLTAQWGVSQQGKLLVNRQRSYRADGSTTDYRLMVAALNECLDLLSRDIALSLRQLGR